MPLPQVPLAAVALTQALGVIGRAVPANHPDIHRSHADAAYVVEEAIDHLLWGELAETRRLIDAVIAARNLASMVYHNLMNATPDKVQELTHANGRAKDCCFEAEEALKENYDVWVEAR